AGDNAGRVALPDRIPELLRAAPEIAERLLVRADERSGRGKPAQGLDVRRLPIDQLREPVGRAPHRLEILVGGGLLEVIACLLDLVVDRTEGDHREGGRPRPARRRRWTGCGRGTDARR